MVKTLNTPNNSLRERQGKDSHFEMKMKRVFATFKRNPSTLIMVSIETGNLRANICRYVVIWEKENRICMVRKGIRLISKHSVGFVTTNHEFLSAIVEPSNSIKI